MKKPMPCRGVTYLVRGHLSTPGAYRRLSEKDAERQRADGCHHYVHVSLVLSPAPCGELEFEQMQTVCRTSPTVCRLCGLGQKALNLVTVLIC